MKKRQGEKIYSRLAFLFGSKIYLKACALLTNGAIRGKILSVRVHTTAHRRIAVAFPPYCVVKFCIP